VSAAQQPGPWDDDLLDARLAALAAHDIPPDEGWGGPDPDGGRPAELAGLDAAELAALIAAAPPRAAETVESGFVPRDRPGGGCGFADGRLRRLR
jgi:hypothetical protein